ncbi:hypothetical protein TNCV_3470991 [Trichonephila clavipes]|nr:hypothetical protein TNCV_3470991 [Trichonephila clavipes]
MSLTRSLLDAFYGRASYQHKNPISQNHELWGDVSVANTMLPREELVYCASLGSFVKAVIPNNLGGPPVDRDGLNAQPVPSHLAWCEGVRLEYTLLCTRQTPWGFLKGIFSNDPKRKKKSIEMKECSVSLPLRRPTPTIHRPENLASKVDSQDEMASALLCWNNYMLACMLFVTCWNNSGNTC